MGMQGNGGRIVQMVCVPVAGEEDPSDASKQDRTRAWLEEQLP